MLALISTAIVKPDHSPFLISQPPAVTDLMVKDASFYFLLYIKFDLIKSFKEVRTKKSQN
jgi:hypothetical protein